METDVDTDVAEGRETRTIVEGDPVPMASANEPELRLLSRDEILNALDQRFEIVPVPEWGEGAAVRIRSLSANERDVFEAGFVDERITKTRRGKRITSDKLRIREVRARLCALAIVDAEGNRVFSQDDVKRLGEKSAAALDRVATAARELSGMTEEDEEDLAEEQRQDPEEASDTA